MSDYPSDMDGVPTCEWGSATLCGQPATWVCYPDKFPQPIYACDQHAPCVVAADRARRLASAPPLPLPDLKAFVTALAWQAVLLRNTDLLRSQNASAAFRMALDEYHRRIEPR